MHEICFSTDQVPVLINAGLYSNTVPFHHADRILPFHDMIYVLKGCIPVTEDMDDYEIREGELLFLKNHVRHYGKTPTNTGTCWIFAHFYLAEPEPGLEPFAYGDPVLSDELDARLSRTLRLPKKMSGLGKSALEEKLKQFIEYVFSQNPVKKLYANTKLYEILCTCALSGYHAPEQSSRLTDQVAAYLDTRIALSFSSVDLEKKFFRTYKHIETVFKKERGITPCQYHTRLRIRTACGLLRSTILSVGEIAEKTGYKDALYFSRVFRKSIGMSPSQYRRQFFQPDIQKIN